MPPRKAPRPRASNPPPTPTPASQFLSAANEVYSINEIRSRILRFLDIRTMAVCMRVEKKGLYEVAKELYREIGYGTAVTMKRANARQRLYSEAVIIIDASSIKVEMLPAPLRHRLSLTAQSHFGMDDTDDLDDQLLESYLSSYHREVFNFIIPPLRKTFPNLLGVDCGLGNPHRTSAWAVRFPAMQSPGSSVVGHIDLVTMDNHYLCTGPVYETVHATPPSDRYTLSERFNLTFYPVDQPSRGSILDFLRNDPTIGRFYERIDFKEVPVSLEDVVNLYDRQVASGLKVHLKRISSLNILPWDTQTFKRFARSSLPSLTSLILFSDNCITSLAEFPPLIATIKTHLPNLEILKISMTGSEDIESICQGLLVEGCLEERGSIRGLVIDTPYSPTPLFNLIRLLSTMCAASLVQLHIYPQRQICGAPLDQRVFLEYCRGQPAHRRAHLATVDIAGLAIESYADMQNLRYDSDGRPRSLLEGKAERWASRTQQCQNTVDLTIPYLPPLSAELHYLSQTFNHLGSVDPTASKAELLEQAEMALTMARVAASRSQDAVRSIQRAAEMSWETAREIESYVQSLRQISDRGGG